MDKADKADIADKADKADDMDDMDKMDEKGHLVKFNLSFFIRYVRFVHVVCYQPTF